MLNGQFAEIGVSAFYPPLVVDQLNPAILSTSIAEEGNLKLSSELVDSALFP